jgi:PPM family protein phosphatase
MSRENTRYLEFTDPGTREENQDNRVAFTLENPAVRNMDRGELFAVADGMGGHLAGREAALACCDRLFQAYYSASAGFDADDPAAMEQCLKTAFLKINRHMDEEGKRNPEHSGWGCTVSALVIRERRYAFAHVGDTRIYRFRDLTSELLTEDQNVAYQMFIHNQTSYEEYLEGFGHNKLLSYMGQGKGMSAKTGSGHVLDGDIFLLCSDGLNQFVEVKQMAGVIQRLAGEQATGEKLMHRLFDGLTGELIKPDEARDNVTFMVVCP